MSKNTERLSHWDLAEPGVSKSATEAAQEGEDSKAKPGK